MTTLADANTAPTGIAINPSLGRQAAALTRSVNLSNEDYAAILQLATLLSGTLTVTANVGTGTQPVSGTITANAGTGTMAVSLASLPALATGANVIGGVIQSGTWNITNISGTISLPTGAATSANQTTLNTNIGSTADAAVANGAGGSLLGMIRSIKDGITSTASSPVTDANVGANEPVAASQTDQVMGTTGATGDWLAFINIQPTSTTVGSVTVKDNATTVYTYPGGTVGADLKPFTVPFESSSKSGAWKISTGAGVTVFPVGRFT
jgi:hypothetical protein